MNYTEVLKVFDLNPIDPVMIGVSLLLFLLFAKVMRGVLLDRYIKLYEEREQKMIGASIKAADLVEEASLLQDTVTQQLREGRSKILNEREAILNQAKEEVTHLLTQKEKQLSEQLQEFKVELDREAQEIRAAAGTLVDNLVSETVQRLVQ